MSEILLELRPKMRSFRLNLGSDVQDKAKFLNSLMSKGIMNVRNFKLLFEGVYSEKSLSLVKKWKDVIFDLSINTTGKGRDFQNCPMLPNLESLSIMKSCAGDISRFITADLAKNISVLRVTPEVYIGSIAVASLKFLNLKQLKIGSPSNLPFLFANADQLQKLFIQVSSPHSWTAKDFPESLPKLQMLCLEQRSNFDGALEKLLKASAKSLKSLVLLSYSSHLSLPAVTVKLENLTSFVYNIYCEIAPDIIKQNASTLEYLFIGLERGHSPQNPNFSAPLPKLKEIVLTPAWKYQMLEPYICQLMQMYPHAKKIRVIEEQYEEFPNAFIKKHHGNDLLRFMPRY